MHFVSCFRLSFYFPWCLFIQRFLSRKKRQEQKVWCVRQMEWGTTEPEACILVRVQNRPQLKTVRNTSRTFSSTCFHFIYFVFEWKLKWKIWCCYFLVVAKEKSNDNSFAIITTTAHWESLHSKFIVNSFSSHSSSISEAQSRSLMLALRRKCIKSRCNQFVPCTNSFALRSRTVSCSKRIFHVIWGVILCSVAY